MNPTSYLNGVIYPVTMKGTGEKMYEVWLVNKKQKPTSYLGLVKTEEEGKALIHKHNVEEFEREK